MDKTARSLPLMSEEWVVKMKLDENVESHPALEGKDGQLAVGASVTLVGGCAPLHGLFSSLSLACPNACLACQHDADSREWTFPLARKLSA